MSFSYDDMRKIIAQHLAESANQSRALDTAIMAACQAAYMRGLKDGVEAIVDYKETGLEEEVDTIGVCK